MKRNPGLRPIGAKEVLSRIIGKNVANVLKSDHWDCVKCGLLTKMKGLKVWQEATKFWLIVKMTSLEKSIAKLLEKHYTSNKEGRISV